MGCGKSTLGRKLATALDCDFVDLDVAIADEYGMSVGEIFARFGEEKFRETESRLLGEIDVWQDTVVATGGGTPCYGDNMALMKSRGKAVYLRLSNESLLKRLLRGRARRPKITALGDEELASYIAEVMGERTRFYSMADVAVDCDDMKVDDAVAHICGMLAADKNG